MIPWGFIIGLLVGGFLMFILISCEDKLQKKQEKWILDDLDNTLTSYNEINVVYDEYNDAEREKAYIFYSCLVSRLMWKGLRIVSANDSCATLAGDRIIRFTTLTDNNGIYFVKKNSTAAAFLSQDQEWYEF